MADLSLRELERAHAAGRAGASVQLASAYLRQDRAAPALNVLGSPPPPQPEALDVARRAWRRVLTSLGVEQKIPASGEACPLGVVADHLVVGVMTAQASYGSLLAIPRHGDPVRLPRVEPPLLVHPEHGLLVPTGRRETSWLRPDPGGGRWEHGPTLRAPLRPGVADPLAHEAILDGALVSLPDLTPLRELFPGACPHWAVHWGTRRIAWREAATRHVFLGSLDGSEPLRLDAARELSRRHPVLAASLGHLEGFHQLDFLSDGRLCLAPPLALATPDGWSFPNRGDPLGLQGPLEQSLDGRALLMFRGTRPVALALDDGGPLPSTRLLPGLWHTVSDCALVHEGEGAPGRLRDVNGEVWFSFPHGLRPLTWTPDGRGVLLQRWLGWQPGPLELWRTQEAA